MIKNERLISTMTLKERIRLIAGFDTFKSSSLNTFEFPIISLESDPLFKAGVFATRFPSERALAAAFDSSVVHKVYRALGEEANACVPYAYYNVSNRFEKTSVSSEPHVASSYLRDKVGGLLYAGTFVNFDNEASADDAPAVKDTTERMTDGILDGKLPSSTLLHGDAEEMRTGEGLLY
ncbi:MAG: hypothetical protein K2M95_05830, partial [Clostridiales bacterium]|nr:hypothetical protein [Clostridiales bacterium]